jgi:FixJ family two-component response regulator
MDTPTREVELAEYVSQVVQSTLQEKGFTSKERPTVLFLDDEKSQIADFEFWARQLNHFRVVSFTDGDKAKDYAERENVAAAVLDCKVPGASGVEVGLSVCARDPGVPIFMTTGYGSEYRLDAAARGFRPTRWIEKPFPGEDVVAETAKAVWKKTIDAIALQASNAVLRRLRENCFCVEEGLVVSVNGEWSRIRFGSGEDILEREFPTWRLHRAQSDEVGAAVVHAMSEFLDMVVSRVSRAESGASIAPIGEPPARLSDEDLELLNRDTEE